MSIHEEISDTVREADSFADKIEALAAAVKDMNSFDHIAMRSLREQIDTYQNSRLVLVVLYDESDVVEFIGPARGWRYETRVVVNPAYGSVPEHRFDTATFYCDDKNFEVGDEELVGWYIFPSEEE